MAKYDSASAKSIELLLRNAEDKIFDLVVEKRSKEGQKEGNLSKSSSI